MYNNYIQQQQQNFIYIRSSEPAKVLAFDES